ncbi:PilW family protein [Desulfobacter latus]|uniref:PilW family protein n=1 Tax=Desulfobacter latus TaxID=2292 RepID=A0A850TGP2_9BACT|nr:PilW family protein [Desulfobacter latus]NWH06706.1 PilW family protein [Desulfobacter latus]
MDKLMKDRDNPRPQAGFTLVELMVALVISFVVVAAVYQTFTTQNKTYIVQERIVEMQQTLRGVLILMENEIRMAGYDPLKTGSFGIKTATTKQLEFTYDDGTGNPRTIRFRLYDSTSDSDTDANELQSTAGGSAVAFHIDDLRFAYAYDADGDGDTDLQGGSIIWGVPNSGTWYNLDDDNDGDIDTDDTAGGTNTLTTVDLDDIRAVRVWVLVRASRTDGDYTDPRTYVLGDQRYTPADNYRRRLGQATILMRNIGV